MSSVSTARPSAGATVMPTLALICTSRVRITNGECEGLAEPPGQLGGVVGPLDPGLQDQELVALRPRQESVPSQGAPAGATATSRSSSEPNSLPNAVVDALEPIEIEMQERQHLVLAAGRAPARARTAPGTARRTAARSADPPASGAAEATSSARSSVTSRATVSTSRRPSGASHSAVPWSSAASACPRHRSACRSTGVAIASSGLEHLLVDDPVLQRVLLAVAVHARARRSPSARSIPSSAQVGAR